MCDFLQKVSDVEFDVMTLSAFLRCVRYGLSELLAYPSMIAGSGDHGFLLRVGLSTMKSWYKLELLRLIRDMEVDSVLAFVAVGRLTKVDWDALGDQEWFPYKYAEGKFVVLPSKLPMVRRNSNGLKVREGGEPEVKPKYRVEFANRGMSIEFARLAWRRYFAECIDFK